MCINSEKEIDFLKKFLREYNGPQIKLMEVCGTHTAEISHCGISDMLSPRISLVSGPGCPVCVTVTSYIDKLISLSDDRTNIIVSFGDMLHVTGKNMNLKDVKVEGANVLMVYSPMDMIKLAIQNPTKNYIFAAVGFETTTAAYAMAIDEIINSNINNIKFLTSLKTMPAAIDWVCKNQNGIDGFLAPGHVSVVTGYQIYIPIAKKYQLPFAVAGFSGEQLIQGIASLVLNKGKAKITNLYRSVVTEKGNEAAQALTLKYFEPCDASWRGFGEIERSGMKLRHEYEKFDAGSSNLYLDESHNPKCCCAKVLTGELNPNQCPLFGRDCTPQNQQGACMVSREGTCYNYFINRRK